MTDDTPRRRGRLRKAHVFAALVAVLAVVFHAPILRVVESLLVVNEPRVPTEFAVIISHNEWGETAFDLWHDKEVETIVLFQGREPRPVRVGAVPSFVVIGRQELINRGVPDRAIAVIRSEAMTHQQAFRDVDRWLQHRPDAHATVLVPRHGTRYSRWVIDSVLEKDRADRLHVASPPVRSFDETVWWQSRTGVKKIIHGYLRLGHFLYFGESNALIDEWDPDEYERSLKK